MTTVNFCTRALLTAILSSRDFGNFSRTAAFHRIRAIEDQAVAGEFHQRMFKEIPAREEQDRKTLETAHGIRLLRPAPAEIEKGRKLMEPYWAEWAQAHGPQAVEALRKVREVLGR